MKIYQSILIAFSLIIICDLSYAQNTVLQTPVGSTPPSGATQSNIIPGPIYVNWTANGSYGVNNGIYIGKGNMAVLTNLAIGVANNGGIITSPLASNSTGSFNTAIGSGLYTVLGNNNTGSSNTAIGSNSMNQNTIGNNNTAVGVSSLGGNMSGSNNSAFGTNSFWSNTQGYNNCGFGVNVLHNNSSGYNNTAMGREALSFAGTDNGNTIIGAYAMSSSLSSGSSNCGLGDHALYDLNGAYNIGIGVKALGTQTSGAYNIAIGADALDYNSGSNNIGIGTGAQTWDKTASNQLSIQNVIYGINMTNRINGNVGIGVVPGTYTGLPTLAKLEVGGTLKVDLVSTGTPPSSNFLFVGTDGIIRQATPTGTGTGNINYCHNVGTIPLTSTTGGDLNCSQIYDYGSNVGIGTSAANTSVKLDLAGQLRVGTVSSNLSSVAKYLYVDNTTGIVMQAPLPTITPGITSTCTNLNFVPHVQTAGSPNLTCGALYDDGTSVGIGTSSPAANLDVNGDVHIQNVPDDAGATNFLSVSGGIVSKTATDKTNGLFWGLQGNSGTNPGVNYLGTYDAKDLSIRAQGNERIRVLATGNVGMGTTTPVTTLEVHNTSADNNITVSGSSPSIHFADNNVGATYTALESQDNHFIRGSSAGDFIMEGAGIEKPEPGGTYSGVIIGSGSDEGGGDPDNAKNYGIMYITQLEHPNSFSIGGTTQVPAPNSQNYPNPSGKYVGGVGINLFDYSNSSTGALTQPTANLHVNGTVRFQALPSGTGSNLVIDNDGNVFVSSSLYRPAASSVTSDSLTDKVNTLETEVKNLKALVELMMANNSSSSNKTFTVYPNPAKNQIQIQPNLNLNNGASQYAEIRDVSNNVVVNKTPFQGSTTISLSSGLSNGTYLVVIYANDKVIQTEKIVVVK